MRAKAYSLWIQAAFYAAAGLNHFINPGFYLPLIPPYLGNPDMLNLVSGIAELVLAGLLLFQPTRYLAAIGIMTMLTAFVPAHVFHIQAGGCLDGGPCVPLWMAWVRLLVIHPLLMVWAWKNRL